MKPFIKRDAALDTIQKQIEEEQKILEGYSVLFTKEFLSDPKKANSSFNLRVAKDSQEKIAALWKIFEKIAHLETYHGKEE